MNGEFSGRIGVIQLGFDPRAEAGPVRPVVAPVRASKPKRGKKAKKAKEQRVPPDEFEAAKYKDADGRECIPLTALKKAIITAATASSIFTA